MSAQQTEPAFFVVVDPGTDRGIIVSAERLGDKTPETITGWDLDDAIVTMFPIAPQHEREDAAWVQRVTAAARATGHHIVGPYTEVRGLRWFPLARVAVETSEDA